METFNRHRFGQVLRLDLAANKNNMFLTATGAPIIAVVIALITTQFFSSKDTFAGSRSLQFCSTNLFLFYAFFPLCILSLCCETFAQKGKRDKMIDLLMLPASNLEKFLVRISYWAMTIIGGILVLFLADGLLLLCYWALDGESTSFIGYAVSRFLSKGMPFVVMTLSAFYAIIAVAFLGAVTIKRQYNLISSGMAYALLAIATSGMESSDFLISSNEISPSLTLILAIVIVAIGTAIFYASYRSFCRWQIATHKILNL